MSFEAVNAIQSNLRFSKRLRVARSLPPAENVYWKETQQSVQRLKSFPQVFLWRRGWDQENLWESNYQRERKQVDSKSMKSVIAGKFQTMASVAVALALSSVASFATDWAVPGDFATIQIAINDASVVNGDRIFLVPGEYAGATVNKAVEIRGEGQATITSGPAHSSGLIQGFRLLAGSDGATLFQLKFKVVDFGIMNADAVNDVTVSHCVFENEIQAISNWRGSRWDISHNLITDLRTRNGGGIGILVGDYSGGVVTDNVIAHNKIMGVLHVAPTDGGGYDGSGIVLFADFRFGRVGTTSIEYNRVIKNKVSLVSDNASVVDVNAVELTDTRDIDGVCVIHDNSVGFNDLRGTANQIVLTPETLDECNAISRNLGENRGHGLHPSMLFNP